VDKTIRDHAAGRFETAHDAGHHPAASCDRQGEHPSRHVTEKLYSELVVGDRVWWTGDLVQVVRRLPSQGNIVRFATELISGPLKGIPCYIAGLSYEPVRVDLGELDQRRACD
jgi:hypothetical protein